jgi:uncharacterized protein
MTTNTTDARTDEDHKLRQRNVEIVEAYLQGINHWDFEGMRDLMADDFLCELPFAPADMMQVRFEGPEELITLQRSLTSTIISENLQDMSFDTFSSDPGEVVATFRSEMEMAGRDDRYRNDYIARFTVRDGKITRFVEYFDAVRLVTGFGGEVQAPKIG